MKLHISVNFVDIIRSTIRPKTLTNRTATHHKSVTSISTNTFPRYYTNINHLKSFDTAFIAYQMMGFGNFE